MCLSDKKKEKKKSWNLLSCRVSSLWLIENLIKEILSDLLLRCAVQLSSWLREAVFIAHNSEHRQWLRVWGLWGGIFKLDTESQTKFYGWGPITRRREELRWSVVLLAFEVPMKPFGILHSLYISFQSENTNLRSFKVILIVLARYQSSCQRQQPVLRQARQRWLAGSKMTHDWHTESCNMINSSDGT